MYASRYRSTTTFRGILLCASVVLAVACDGGGRSEEDAAPAASDSIATDGAVAMGPKACDLAAEADLERITARELQPARTTNDYMGVSQCQWDAADAPDSGIVISLHQNGRFENYQRVEGSTPVEGIGDEAVWNPTSRQLAFRQGAAVVSISFLMEPAERKWGEEIGRAVVARLQETAGD